MDFSDLIFYLKTFKINKKNCKKRAGPTRVRCGAQGHVAEPRGPAQRLRGAFYIYSLFIITISIKGLQPSLYGKGY